MSQQQLGRRPPRHSPAPPAPDGAAGGQPTRFVGWLGGFGALAAGYAVFQFLFEVLPDSLDGEPAKYLIAGVSGLGTGLAAWLAAALVRARTGAVAAPGTPTTAPGPLPQVFADAYDTLSEQLTVDDDPDRGPLIGWSHALGESSSARPTAVGTAYGLHIMLDLGVPDGRLSTGDLVDTLWRLRLPDGGWSARSQGSEPRPEVTALVLGALARAGASRARLADEVARCTDGFSHELDSAGRQSTHVVTTVLRGLLRAAPDSALLPRLREAIVDGALSDPGREHLRCWDYRLDLENGRASALHTAQAVVALDRAARILGDNAAARATREDGVRWLLACPDGPHDSCADLANFREEVRRPRSDDPARHEVLNVRHFTAAWVVRALMSPTASRIARAEGLQARWRERLDGAVAAVWAGQTDGIWTWELGDGTELRRPIWMTYQGLCALRAHAVWMYQPDQPDH
ncbi:hypothetical protein ACIHFB_18545 [Streptomyces sp. NPDC051963]|uniref:hypothetical protein n=1 Tax=Streptomyces sp. NPDC051963 TaxID=3365678 RepID=UPI0037D057C1